MLLASAKENTLNNDFHVLVYIKKFTRTAEIPNRPRLFLHGRQNLRSATDRTYFLPRTHNTFGDRSFSVAGPRVWNSLPADLRLEMQFRAFRRQLKTVLFSR